MCFQVLTWTDYFEKTLKCSPGWRLLLLEYCFQDLACDVELVNSYLKRCTKSCPKNSGLISALQYGQTCQHLRIYHTRHVFWPLNTLVQIAALQVRILLHLAVRQWSPKALLKQSALQCQRGTLLDKWSIFPYCSGRLKTLFGSFFMENWNKSPE